MTQTSQVHNGQSKKISAMVVSVVAAFSLVCIGLVVALEAVANPSGTSELQGSATLSTDPFYVLLIGSDSRKGTALYTGKENEHAQTNQHSDVMTLMRIDPQTYTLTLVTIPRDTILQGSTSRVNDALLENDPERVVEVAEKLTGVEIPYYMMTTFTSFQKLIDAMGGVTVDVPKDIEVPDPMTTEGVKVRAGKSQTLDGSKALVLARARREYVTDQDALRQVNVRNIELAIIQKVLDISDKDSANQLLSDLEKNMITNLDFADMGYLTVDFFAHRNIVTIYSCTGPWDGGENDKGLWVVEEDRATWAKLMEAVDAGADPTGIVAEPRHS